MSLVLIDRTAGTNIGDMTDDGGLAASFDGTTSQAASACSSKATHPGYVGKTLAAPKIFGQAICYSSNNGGWTGGGANPTITLTVRGKNGTAPSGSTDGTVLGTATFTDTNNESGGRTINTTDPSTLWDHLFLEVERATAGGICSAELVLYERKSSGHHHYTTMQNA